MRHLSIITAIVFLATFWMICTDAGRAVAQSQEPPRTTQKPGSAGKSMGGDESAECKLREDMRKLWSDHVIWTRSYIVAAVDDAPDQEAAARRLLKNQEDIGKAIVPFYGKEAGDKLTTLLKEHITISVDLIKAAKAHDQNKVREIDQKWRKNGDDIADFLSEANPNWPRATLADMMKMHLSTTTDELMARLDKKWDKDVKAFDDVYEHILRMSDALADGIIKQFPDKFS